ncbi:unnamed protein product [Fraxinus pennsylvanica]|uniref:Disease resistance R13L4/SHOC-2-like LRR domain-containing protein n=1 Tax=Fraxinus pennsylvanica TaxID=56036 RepID=A0AAD2EA56_9LAMI|nr:unnamed protein product [Fraxinus pennsylvanica]
MPSTIRNLKKLVTLDILLAHFNCGLPTTIFRMKHLKYLILGYDKTFESNKCTNLNVRNEVYLPNVETLFAMPGTILKASSLQKLSNLRELTLYETNNQHINVISGKTPISEKLQDLDLHFTQKFNWSNLSQYDHLASLTMRTGFDFPFNLDTIEFPPNLIFLNLLFMKFTEDPMKVLKELRKLEFLELLNCEYNQSIPMDFSGENSFPELQVLSIYRLAVDDVIPELIVDQRGMPKLNKAWVSEKLIQVDGNRNLDDIVAIKLEMLSDRNLIQASSRDSDGRVESCRIHDLLRFLCIEKANENNFFFNALHDRHSNSFSMLRRLTIDNTSQFSFSKTPKLRTLFCFSNSREGWTLIPNEIGDLSRLTFLMLRGRFERMPSTIRNLKKLVTLDILLAHFNCGLPRTIFRMKHLKHLLVGSGKTFESNKCTNLNVRNEVYLPNVETLFGMPVTILKASSLQNLSTLRELFLYEINDQCINVISGKTPISEKLHYLELLFTQKFERLNLSRYDRLASLTMEAGSDFPFNLDTIEFPPNLISLELSFLKFTEDPMKVLKELRKLEFLQLSGCKYSQSITMDFSGENSFPELRVLLLYGLFPELIVDQRGMPKLNKFVCSQKGINVPERLREIMEVP